MLVLQPFCTLAAFQEPIEAIGTRCGVPDLFTQIRCGVANGRAFLMTDDDSFCVLRPRIEKGDKVIEVWAASGKGGNAIRAHFPQAQQMALAVGAKYLQFWTVLPALNRLARRLGFEPHRTEGDFTIWRMPL
ncbi:hypothetical protein [Microbulbifer discodermiae]|uniref:hypothetical protein n=2 Tax=unclassified Microbulbifer TaxID=2619833 RepID=UPI00345C198D